MGANSSRRPPPGQRAAGLQLVHCRVEPLVLHQPLADLGLQPTVVFVHDLRRATLQPRPAAAPVAADSSICFFISTLLLRELSRNQVSKKTLAARG